MGQFVVGQVVLVNFPFSNLKGQKLRPALILAKAEFDNLILCQITSKPYSSKSVIILKPTDFAQGQLPITSYIRPDKLFTCDPTLISKIVGQLNPKTMKSVLSSIRDLFAI